MNKFVKVALIGIPLILLLCILLYFLPPVRDAISWRVDEWVLRAKYRLNPPQEVVFVPGAQNEQTSPAPVGLTETPTPTATLISLSTESVANETTVPTEAITPTPGTTPLPAKVSLSGVRYDDQHGRYNYCAPANLSMALSFWGWQGNNNTVGPVLKPNSRDKNVMPYEMVDYVNEETDLNAVERVGGDLDTIKRFLAAGYPVLVEKGTHFRDLTGVVSWMGHYQVITGYDDTRETFTAQDSFTKPDEEVPYDEMIQNWRAFNYTYIIIYPPEKEAEVMDLLGTDADEGTNYQNAALKASNEIYGLSGVDQFFAWYNRGTNLVKLQDYAGASTAYDEAFAVYATLPLDDRPWRMLWYQTGPYFAYYYNERYYDVLSLAGTTLGAMQSDKNLEESYYWRGMAKAALGDTAGAVEDFKMALQYHQGFEPALYQLSLLGVTNP